MTTTKPKKKTGRKLMYPDGRTQISADLPTPLATRLRAISLETGIPQTRFVADALRALFARLEGEEGAP